MTRFRRLIGVGAVTTLAAASAASAASAATFYVNQRGEVGACTAPGKHACLTIKEAVEKAEKSAPPNTIEVEPGEGGEAYEESIDLSHGADARLTINGDGAGVVVESKTGPAVALQAVGGPVVISNMAIDQLNTTASIKAAIADHAVPLTLENVSVENQSGSGVDGIEVHEAPVTMSGGSVSMENGATGDAIYAYESPLTVNGATILSGSESEADAGGVYSERSTLALKNTNIGIESGSSTIDFAISAGNDSSVAIEGVNAKQNTHSLGVVFENSPASVDGLRIEMLDSSSALAALLSETGTEGTVSSFSHLETSGTWTGSSLLVLGGEATVSDSRLINSALSELVAVGYLSAGTGRGLLVQRSVMQTGPKAKHGALNVDNGNATTDSSEILGGEAGIQFENTLPLTHTLTVSASTIDAGAPGITADAAGVTGVEAIAKNEPGSTANVKIQGSIVLEKQTASAAVEDAASISCTYSAVPNQSQAAGGGAGAIACATGSSANTEVSPLSSLFPEPLSEYQLSPTSSALDSVPASALSLPFGLTASVTDLAGNARVVDGNGDCVAVQDKGALELQGHSASCPSKPVATPILSPATPKPVAGILTGLTLSPGAFFPAPSGATISSTGKAKKKYGTKISYRDSQVATTTFTILRKSSGRKHGKACQKPSQKNKHGKRCTLLVKVGSFTHTDTVGANSLHFSGRIKGKKLPAGAYELQAVAHDAAGNGAAVVKTFTIK